MDLNAIKEKIEQLAGDDAAKEQLKKDPIHTIESTFGIDLPDEQIAEVIKNLKDKVGDGDYLDKIKEKITNSDVLDKLKGEAEEILDKVEESGVVDKIKEGIAGLFHKE